MMMIVGCLIASGFLLAQRSQINAHQIRQAEESFKTQLDEMSNQQRYYTLEKERAINAEESSRIAKQSGLGQPQLKGVKPAALAQVMSAKPAAEAAVRVKAEPLKQPLKSASKPAAPLSKTPAKSVAAHALVLPNPAVKLNKAALPNRAAVNQRQLAQKPVQKPVQKDARKLAPSAPAGKKEKRR